MAQRTSSPDVRLIDIAEFTTRMTFGAKGMAALFLKEGKLIAPPRDSRFNDHQTINQALLRTPKNLSYPNLPKHSAGGRHSRPQPGACMNLTARTDAG